MSFIKQNKVLELIIEFNRVLKMEGILHISVPDFDKVVKIYMKNKDLSEIIGFLNGGQKNEYDIHYINYNETILKDLLISCGFDQIEIYDPHEFLKDNQDDYSKAYLPHMDKCGELMSLNIVCRKVKDLSIDQIVLGNKINKIFNLKI